MVFWIPVCGDGYRMGLGDFDTSGFGTSDGCTWQKAFSYSKLGVWSLFIFLPKVVA